MPTLAAEREVAPKSPPRAEGEGPFDRLILRGVTVIDGTGAPARGPMDIVVEGNRIVSIRNVGSPGSAIDPKRRPEVGPDDKVLELEGHYVLPGFVDLHGHLGGSIRSTPAEYVLKLWMGHGVTTSADPGSGNGLDWTLEHKRKSEANEITAPRIEAYSAFGQDHEGPISTPEQAREWVRGVAQRGADGVKFFGLPPDIMEAAIDEAGQQGLYTT
ncbi:MAG: amidohydrolase, partial [Thermoanaerobaculia bacterium]